MDFIDLKSQYRRIEADVRARLDKVLAHGQFIMGPEIAELEAKLAAYTGAKHCLACASGTDALLLALMAWKIGPGDAVFTTPFTFIATAEVIALVGATPVFVDIDPRTYNIDAAKLEAAVKSLASGAVPSTGTSPGLRARAVIPVDLFGLCADYGAVNAVAKKHGLLVLEDACQSFGASYNGKRACSFGDAAATSFFPAKPLGCFGDGGAVFTGSDELAATMRSIRIHGQGSDKYNNVRIGINGRLDTMQAAILLAKMEIFGEEMQQRQAVAARYAARLAGAVTVPTIPEGHISAWAQYSIQHDNRQAAMDRLKNAGIPAAIYYPKPLHMQEAFAYLGYAKGTMPVSEQVADRIFSLPMHPYLGERDQGRIAAAVKR